MNLRKKTLEELEDIEQELLDRDEEEEKYGYYQNFVSLYSEIHRQLIRLSRGNREEYQVKESYVKGKLVQAANHLIEVLKYDPKNPIAHYRMGFLAYKHEDFAGAVYYFQKVLQYDESYEKREYKLNTQQLYFANLYLSNSALYIAQKAQKSAELMQDDVHKSKVENFEMSPLYKMIQDNESYLKKHAFTITTSDGTRQCSKSKCQDIALSNLPDTLILNCSDQGNTIIFNGREEPLETDQIALFRHYFLYSNEANPVTKYQIIDIFQTSGKTGEVPDNTYSVKVLRLRRKLAKVEAPTSLIENKRFKNQTAYFYNHALPYMIIHRTDDSFFLDNNDEE